MTEQEFGSDEGDYATPQNIEYKAMGWLDELEAYCLAKKRFEPRVKDMALLVIDAQNFFVNPDSHAYVLASRGIMPNIKRLIDKFRELGQPVIFTRHAYLDDEEPGIMNLWWGDSIRDSDPLSQVSQELAPRSDETVIRKTRYSAFIGTGLEAMLHERGIDTILITGVVTHLCCESTAREAFMKDLEVYMAIDGTASYSEELHMSSLRTLANGFAIPMTTQEMMVRLTDNNGGIE